MISKGQLITLTLRVENIVIHDEGLINNQIVYDNPTNGQLLNNIVETNQDNKSDANGPEKTAPKKHDNLKSDHKRIAKLANLNVPMKQIAKITGFKLGSLYEYCQRKKLGKYKQKLNNKKPT
jgi:hypothetical protein